MAENILAAAAGCSNTRDFEQSLAAYRAAEAITRGYASDDIADQGLNALVAKVNKAEKCLMTVPARDLHDVITKLEIIWDASLLPSDNALYYRHVLVDLKRLARA